jgi:methylenetetrahydrofolate dehydrogenase (NADP+)/methenyltetrahydrofolate cyclohydrolase
LAVPATIIDGQTIAQQVLDEVRNDVERLKSRGVEPGLAVILVGDNPASVSYVRGKTRDALEVGMRAETLRMPADTPEAELLDTVARLNSDPGWHGILVQLPLPSHINESRIIGALAVEKDVDGLHPVSVGRLFRGEPGFRPCTPNGVMQLLKRTGNDPGGKHVVVCGRSNLVGKPLAGLLMQKAGGANATVTVCHTGTPDIGRFTRDADIVVTAMGQPRVLTADMVRPGAVVIDVGVNRIADPTRKSGGRLVGDVDFDAVSEIAGAITPVPGGVGPMTRAMLLYNTIVAASGGPEQSDEG